MDIIAIIEVLLLTYRAMMKLTFGVLNVSLVTFSSIWRWSVEVADHQVSSTTALTSNVKFGDYAAISLEIEFSSPIPYKKLLLPCTIENIVSLPVCCSSILGHCRNIVAC